MSSDGVAIAVPAYVLSEADFDWVRRHLKARAGIDIAPGKLELVTGRIARRLRALGLDGFSDYRGMLESGEHPEEERAFVNVLTTNVTSFFREAHHFERLRGIVRERAAEAAELRLWSAGCSSGEEPYSIAMSALDALGGDPSGVDLKVLGTDIDTAILEQARQGVYPLEQLAGLEHAVLARWFQKGRGRQEGKARVRPELARLLRFRHLNLIKSWPFTGRFDAVFCRNVMIYFDKPTRHGLVDRFARVLQPGGYLFIGHSETVEADHPLLESIGQTTYRRRRREPS